MMFKKSLGSAAAAFILVATAAGPAAARGDRQHARGLIVAERFSAQNNGNPQIVAVRPGDGRVTVLTSGSQDLVPDLAPDGRSIVFQRCLHALNCDQIGAINIWTMRADGSSPHPLTACDGTRCLGAFTPAFSRDGRLIAFEEDLLDANGINFNGIFVMRTDGSHVRRITTNGPDNLPDSQPQFSPDGTQLVFERELPAGNQLMIVRVDGTGLRPLLPGVEGFTANWAPDGKRLVFTLGRQAGESMTFDIATVRPNGTDLRLLTDTAPGSPAFTSDYAPGGQRIVYSQADADGCHLVIAGVMDTYSRSLPTGPGCFVDASWGWRRS
jgi:Tol biopolymer transport system component